MLTRENLTGLAWRRNARRSRTTAGILITRLTDRTLWSYSSITSTLPRNRRVIARCQEMTLIGSKPWDRSSVRVAVAEASIGLNIAMVYDESGDRASCPGHTWIPRT